MRPRVLVASMVAAVSLLVVLLPTALADDFDTSGLPKPPTTFEEQKLWDTIETAGQYPELAADAHEKLAAYYEKKGLLALAARERAAISGGSSSLPATPVPTAIPDPRATDQPPAQPSQPPAGSAEGSQTSDDTGISQTDQPSEDDQLDPRVFDLSAFPAQPTNFEEQLIRESLDDPNTLDNPVLLAFAHRQLGRYYAALGRVDLAGTEYSRAIVALPEDHRSYTGLAALHEAVGSDAGDGNVALRDVAQQLQDQGLSIEDGSEPEPEVKPSDDASQWQEVSAEFNRRMNYMYTSRAWDGVYRTVFTNLYGR